MTGQELLDKVTQAIAAKPECASREVILSVDDTVGSGWTASLVGVDLDAGCTSTFFIRQWIPITALWADIQCGRLVNWPRLPRLR